jgi:septal ring-binding cell division protein DamX
MPTTGLDGTAVLTGAAPRMAASSSAVADASDASVSATLWSSSSADSARKVTREPAADLTVILIGASVEDMLLLD